MLQGKGKQQAGRFRQQVTPLWEAAWGKSSDDHPTRVETLPSRDCSSAELPVSLSPASFVILLLSYAPYPPPAPLGSLASVEADPHSQGRILLEDGRNAN